MQPRPVIRSLVSHPHKRLNVKPSKHDPPHKVMFVAGATAQIAPPLILRGLKEGYKVIGLARNIHGMQKRAHLEFHALDPKGMLDVDYWDDLIYTLREHATECVFVNAIGTAVPQPGQTMEDANKTPVVAATVAFEKVCTRTQSNGQIVHISSLAASILQDEHEYSKVKGELDIFLHRTINLSTLVIRPGIVFNDVLKQQIIKEHPYSPEQLAKLPLQPILGSGKQYQQPVFSGDIEEAVFNHFQNPEDSHLVEAVGPDLLSQEAMFRFFCEKVLGKRFRPVYIPYESAEFVANYAPMGRIAPYAIALFKKLDVNNLAFCSQKFQKLVGKPLTGLENVYLQNPVIINFPPVKEHIKKMGKAIIRDPKCRKELFQVAWKNGGTLMKNVIKGSFKNPGTNI